MKTKVITITILLFFAVIFTAFSQQRVILQSNGTATAFGTVNSFVDAYNAAQDGDTIYLPGLEYVCPSPFNKRLVVFGTGHDPEATSATGRTIITSSNTIVFDPGASGSHLEGMYIGRHVGFRSNNKVDNVTFKRVHINGGISIVGTNPENRSENLLITESVFNGINGQNASNMRVFNSFSNGGLQNLNENSWIANNIIIDNFYPVSHAYQSHFENNIIITIHSAASYTGVYFSNGNTFRNNIFNKNPTIQDNNTWENNYTNTDPTALFVGYQTPFSYDADYHLNSPVDFPGTTGDQAGLFGGYHPFKENALPVTPHILNHTIATSADVEGNLQISISVQAQDR